MRASSQNKDDKVERLIFLEPMEQISVDLLTTAAGYEPGDKVDLRIKAGVSANLNASEIVYASIKVSDLSSILKVESYKQPPNLYQMVYLEKEIKQLNTEIDEFLYSDEFLSFAGSGKPENLDALLGMQTWRRYKFDDVDSLRSLINSKSGDEKHLYEYLLADQGYQIYYRGGMVDDMAFDAPLPFARNNMAGEGMMEKAMMRPMAIAEAAPAPAPVAAKKVAGDNQAAAENVASNSTKVATGDFLQKIIDSRSYVHQRLYKYSPNGPRRDFTQTLLFNSAIEMRKDSDTQRLAEQSFYLNDQVSTF